MWYEMRRQQHRTYWRTGTGRDYEVFPTEDEARLFIGLCKTFGRAEIVTRHQARATGAAATMVTTVPAPTGATVAVPALRRRSGRSRPGRHHPGLAGRAVRDQREPGQRDDPG